MAKSNNPKDLRGTQTEKNLVLAYLAESAAYTRYTYYAKQATKENYFPVAELFTETAENELHHSKVFFKMLQGGVVQVPISVDAGVIGDTVSNLKTAMAEELKEGVEDYTTAAKVADKEGFPEVAEHFRAIASVEQHHHDRFERFLKMVEDGTLWKRAKSVTWQCTVCGYIIEGKEPPVSCPACDHPYQHYICPDDFVI